MKNLLTHLITLCLVVFCFNLSKAQESLVQQKSNPGFYEIISVKPNTDDLKIEGFCYLLNRKANMADYIDSETIVEFDDLSILFFKTYDELIAYQKTSDEEKANTKNRAKKITVSQLPERLTNAITQPTQNK